MIKSKAIASLASPDVTPQFKNAEILHSDVNHGNVVVYIVADAPPVESYVNPHVTPIQGARRGQRCMSDCEGVLNGTQSLIKAQFDG